MGQVYGCKYVFDEKLHMRVLITGITGFTGSHLAELCLENNIEVFGTVRGRCRQTNNIDHIIEDITLLECDLTDYKSVDCTITEAEPDNVFHLAAQSFVPTSWRAPQETINTNVIGTLNLLEAIRKSPRSVHIHIAGSSEEYGMVLEDETPIKETNPLRPLSPYGVSKVAQDLLGYQYYKSYGMPIYRTRSFNIIGPRSADRIVSANFAKQVVKMERKDVDDEVYQKLNIGNLDAIRDFVDVRDVCRAYLMCISKCDRGEVYNISSDIGHKISDIVEELYKNSTIQFGCKRDKTRDRPSDVPKLIGDSTKFRMKTGWKPEYTFEQSMKDVLDYWRGI